MARSYGGFTLERGICLECGGECFICIDDSSSCCNASVKPYLSGAISNEVEYVRKRQRTISEGRKNELLEQQGYRCFWCGNKFGEVVMKGTGIITILRPVWDHYTPFAYTGSCNDQEFVGACQICNGIKGAMVITSEFTEEHLRAHIKQRWAEKGHTMEAI